MSLNNPLWLLFQESSSLSFELFIQIIAQLRTVGSIMCPSWEGCGSLTQPLLASGGKKWKVWE